MVSAGIRLGMDLLPCLMLPDRGVRCGLVPQDNVRTSFPAVVRDKVHSARGLAAKSGPDRIERNSLDPCGVCSFVRIEAGSIPEGLVNDVLNQVFGFFNRELVFVEAVDNAIDRGFGVLKEILWRREGITHKDIDGFVSRGGFSQTGPGAAPP
jgi:hypothetical protein